MILMILKAWILWQCLNQPLKNGTQLIAHIAYVGHTFHRLASRSSIQDASDTCKYNLIIF